MATDAMRFDVVVAGAGMVGLTLAAALGQGGLRVALLDPRDPEPDHYARLAASPAAEFDPRVSALTDASRAILDAVGAWGLISALRAAPYAAMEVWDGPGTSRIRFAAAELQRPHLGHIVENRVTVAALERVVAATPAVTWLAGCRVVALHDPLPDGRGCGWRRLLLSDQRELSTRLLVIADGARSPTRRLAGFSVSEWDYDQHAVVTTLCLAEPHQDTAWQCFTEQGPLAFLPLPTTADGTHRVSIVWSTAPAHARELLELAPAAFCQRLQQAFEGRFTVRDCDPRFSFPLTQRHAARYVDEGLALAGDAAHSIHPLAGQGVNLGLLDAATLAEVVLDTQAAGGDFGERRWLRRYQRRRQGENLKMIALMGALHHLYGEVPPLLQWLRNAGLRQVAAPLPLRQLLSAHALGIRGPLPRMARG